MTPGETISTLTDTRADMTTPTDQPEEVEEYPLPNRRRVLAFAAESAVVLIVASVVSLLVQWIINRSPIPPRSNVPAAITWTVVLVVGCAALVLLWRRWSRPATVVAWLLPAILTSTVQALTLFGTSFYLFGTNGDQFFRIQYLQRLTVSASLADDNYAGIPPFYSAGWFWIGGRFANLIGHPAWSAYKPFAILTIAVTSSLVFVLWSLVVARRKALGVAMVFAVAGTVVGPYEPYSWFAMALVPPLVVLAWRLFRTVATRRDVTGLGPVTVLIGLGIGICAAVYTLVFGFTVLLVVAIAFAVVVVGRFDGSLVRAGIGLPGLSRALVIRLVLIGIAALPITVLTWGPYLYAAIRLPSAGNGAAEYYPIGMATLATPMLQPSITGVICLIGLVWIILAWQRSSVAQALGITALGCVAWELASTAALAENTTLLSSHIARMGEIVLWCAGAFALIDLAQIVPRGFKLGHRRNMRALVSVLAILVTISLTQTPPSRVSDLLSDAFTSYDANGHAAVVAKGNSAGKYNKQLIEAIAQLTKRPPQDNILLTNDYQLLDFQPYHSFQTNKEQYANPLARYPERNQELTRWSGSSTPAELMANLSSSEFTPPNVFVFTRDSAGNYPFDIVTTDFPYDNKTHRITFAARALASPQFASRDVGPFTVIVANASVGSAR
jgi:galactan 5-O-arabinofuranosyltransferase